MSLSILPRPPLRVVVGALVALALLGAGVWYWQVSGRRQSTDDAQSRVDAAQAGVNAAQARLAKARAAVTTPSGGVTPAVRVAQAELDKARLDLEHAVMRAPEDGWVTHFDLTPGTVVTPGTPLFALVVANSFWVDANFKETELGGVHPGLPATIVVDMYPDHAFHGHVESLAGGTGAAFSLLPPQNASGNRVKVAPAVSRVPITLAVMAATVIQVLDTTIVNVALRHMAGALAATTDQVSWVLTSYIVASALCGIATSLAQMVLFRLLQGLFGALLVPLSQAIMVDTYPPHERGKALAIWGMGVMAAPILGPTVGGWLTESLNWRWNFYINVPIGALSLLLAARYVPDTAPRERRMDWWGLVFLALFIAGLQYTLDRGQQADWLDSRSIRLALAVLCAGLAAFVWHCVASRRQTLFSLRIFADRNFIAASIVGAAMGPSLYGGMLLQPLLFEGILQFPTFDTGLAMVPRGIGSLISMLLVGRLLGHFGAKKLIYVGIGASLAGAWMMTRLDLDITGRTTLVPLLVQGFGVGFVFIPLAAVAFATLPRDLATEAAGVYNLIRSLGSSIGISIVSVYMARSAQASWGVLRGYVDPFRVEVQQYLDPLGLKARGAGLALLAQRAAQQAQMLGLLQAFWLIVASFVAMAPLVMLLRPARGGAQPDAAAVAE